jgi:membrane associated rhomboid family serine protease
MFTITNIIIAITCIISLIAFNNPDLKFKFMFYPYQIKRNNQHQRFLSHAFIHADYMHLFFNMFTLYSFGNLLESTFLPYAFDNKAKIIYILLYTLAIYASSIYDYIKHKDNSGYMSLGASGATSAVLFACILFIPWPEKGGISLFFLPISIPPIIFGVLYLAYSAYAAKKSNDNIGHDAHFFGAIFGFLFLIVLKPTLFLEFIDKILAKFH